MDYTPGRIGAKVEPGTTQHADPLRYRETTDADAVEAQRRYVMAVSWTPPAGHATWCQMQLPPAWRHRAAGDTPMAAKQCGCGKSKAAKLARRRELRGLMAEIGRKVA